jgi:hypothetical protein
LNVTNTYNWQAYVFGDVMIAVVIVRLDASGFPLSRE